MNARKEFDQFMQKTTVSDQEFADFKSFIYRNQLSLARKTAASFGIAAITVMIAFVYGFVTNEVLKNQRLDILYYQKEATQAAVRVAEMEAQLIAAQASAEAARAEAESLLSTSQEKSKATNSKK